MGRITAHHHAGRTRAGAGGLSRWWRDSVAESLLSVLFPPRCVGCGDFESYLCDPCRLSLDPLGPRVCPRCGEPAAVSPASGRCARCMGLELPFATARGALHHRGVARRLVTEFKFGGQPVLGRIMGEVARSAFDDFVSSVGPAESVVVTWVPCHRAAERERGYNQAEVLARSLASGALSPKCLPLVRKIHATRHQKGLGRAGRQGNLVGAFALDESASARVSAGTKAVILVDDVYTTGATAGEVSSVLGAGIGLPVHVFTFSRAVAGGADRHD